MEAGNDELKVRINMRDLGASRALAAKPVIDAMAALFSEWDDITIPNGFTASHVVKGLEEKRKLLHDIGVLAGAMPEIQEEEHDA